MLQNEKCIPAGGSLLLILIFLNALILKLGFIKNTDWYWLLIGTLPLLAIAVYDVLQKKQAMAGDSPLVKAEDGRLWVQKV